MDSPKEGFLNFEDKGSVGKLIVGISTVAALLIVITGLMLWWPKSKSMLKSRLTVKCNNLSTFCYTFHAAGGFYISIFLLVIILTGLTWSFGWYKDFLTMIIGDIPSFKPIHTCTWLGIFGKTLWFIVAIVGASLPVTGTYLWLKRRKTK